MMPSPHSTLLTSLKRQAGKGTKHTKIEAGYSAYLGHRHFSYDVSNPIKRSIIREFVKENKDISFREYIALLDSMFRGPSYDEKSMAGMLIEYYKDYKGKIMPSSIDRWLGQLEGWAEVDSLCQGNFTAEEILANWTVWKPFLIKLSKDKSIIKRRASLVLLTDGVSHSNDKRLTDLAFKNIDTLKPEKDILITKAISWLLRSMVRHHKKEVALYLKRNFDSLPKIAVRETKRKIETGRK